VGYLRKSKLEDFKFVVENMREMDRLETYYQTDMTPEDALSVVNLHESYGQQKKPFYEFLRIA
jgi:hypothetical protein